MNDSGVISVLIVDDSAMVRKVLSMGFESDPGFRVVGMANNVEVARQMIEETRPDVLTLDIEMPRIDGLTWLRELMADAPIPVVIISSLIGRSPEISMQAMEYGAVDVIEKPTTAIGMGVIPVMTEIRARVRAAAKAQLRPVRALRQTKVAAMPRPSWPRRNGQKIMAIGSSTGGVQALARLMPQFPADSPALLIVQHMPQGFTESFANRLNGLSKMEVREARDGDLVQDGLALVAPGGERHMELRREGFLYRVALVDGPPVCFSRPSVDVLFRTAADCAGPSVTAAILTGMGRDGSAGLLRIRQAGGRTIAQDAETSVVYGMPAAAAELGAAQQIAALDSIPALMLSEEGQPLDIQSPLTAATPPALPMSS